MGGTSTYGIEQEDAVIRGVLRLNGVLEYRYWGDRGVFTYTQSLK